MYYLLQKKIIHFCKKVIISHLQIQINERVQLSNTFHSKSVFSLCENTLFQCLVLLVVNEKADKTSVDCTCTDQNENPVESVQLDFHSQLSRKRVHLNQNLHQ